MMYFCSNVALQLRPGWFPFLLTFQMEIHFYISLVQEEPISVTGMCQNLWKMGTVFFPVSPLCQLWLW